MGQLIKNIGKYLFLFLSISLVTFAIMQMAPSDPAMVKLSSTGLGVNQEALDTLRHQLGIDLPLWQQYFNWLFMLLKGDLGESLTSPTTVSALFWAALPNTLQLAIGTLLVTLLCAIPIGIYLGQYPHHLLARSIGYLNAVIIAIPNYTMAYLLMYLLGVYFNWLPLIYVKGTVSGLIMPILALAFPMIAKFSQQISAMVIEEKSKSYVTALYYRGISQRRIYWQHIFKNCLPIINLLIMFSLGSLLGGVVIIESIFYLPGIGKLLMDAVNSRDYPTVQIVVLFISLTYMVLSSVTDWINHKIDKRMG